MQRRRKVFKRVIKIDYDKTIDMAKYPSVGSPVPYAIDTIKYLKSTGRYLLVLDTCRKGEYLNKAVEFLESQGVFFDYINENTDNSIAFFGDTRKIYADISIDDKNMFTPLDDNKCVDWVKVRDKFGLYTCI